MISQHPIFERFTERTPNQSVADLYADVGLCQVSLSSPIWVEISQNRPTNPHYNYYYMPRLNAICLLCHNIAVDK